MDHGPVFFRSAGLSSPPAATRETFRQQLVAHSVESHFKVLHPSRVDDGVEEGLEDDQTVDCDANWQRYGRVETVERHDAIFAVNDEPNDGRHPANNEGANDEQCCDYGLS